MNDTLPNAVDLLMVNLVWEDRLMHNIRLPLNNYHRIHSIVRKNYKSLHHQQRYYDIWVVEVEVKMVSYR
jgi:hypothetical protein